MPITITAPQPGFEIGPGCVVGANTDFDFSTSLGYEWSIAIETEGGVAVRQRFILHQEQQFSSTFLTEPRQTGIDRNIGVQLPREGEAVSVRFQIATPTTVAQEAVTQAVWSPTVGLGVQAYLNAQSQTTAQGGFTEADRQLLTQTEARSTLLGEVGQLVVQTASGLLPTTLAQLFSINSLDRLILEEMTSGPTCDPVRIDLAPIAQFAIVVRLTTIPEEIVFRTPDGEWSFVDLAVLRIFRGQDLVFRRGIHTPTFESEAPWEWASNPLNKNLFGTPPPATRVWVDWRAGCCGQVFIRHTP